MTVAASSEKDIKTFSFVEQTIPSVIDANAHTVAMQVANGTNLHALIASFTLSSGASVKIGTVDQVSGTTANDFTSPFTYIVKASDGSTQSWTVTVTEAPSMNIALVADTTNNNTVSPIEITFTDDLAWRAAITAIVDGSTTLSGGLYTVSTGKITINAGVLTAGSHTIKVIAAGFADAAVSQYILPNNAKLSGLHVSSGRLNETFDAATTSYTQTVEYSVSSLTVTPQVADPTSTVQVNNVSVPNGQASGTISLQVGNNPITIRVTAEDQTSKTYTINVTRKNNVPPSGPYYPVTDVSLDKPELIVTAGGETAVLHATIRPSYATYTSVTWSSSDPKVATVDSNGVVTPLSPGAATITVTTADQAMTASSKVSVVEAAKLIGLKASEKAVLLKPNKSSSIRVYAIYSNGIEKDITKDRAVKYSTSSKTKATVTAGVIKAGKTEGTEKITVTYRGQKVKIPVRISKLQVTKVELQPSTLEIALKQEKHLQVTATLSNKKTEKVTELATWLVSDETVVEIDENGKLTAIAPGTVTVTAKYGGKSSKMTVEVNEAKQVKRIAVNKRKVTISAGKEQNIKLTAYYEDNSKKIVTEQAKWLSEDETIASVKNGVISGIATGTVDIQVSYQGKTVTISVTVKK